jgi:hypothetical protein
MSNLQTRGKVTLILLPQNGVSKSGKEWSKRDFVIETEGEYPKLNCFTLFGDKANILDNINIGATVNVHFNLESREFNGRYFHNLNAWKVEVDDSAKNTFGDVPDEMNKAQGYGENNYFTEEEMDLLF